MRFPWRKKPARHPSDEAQKAHEAALESMAVIDSRWDEVRSVTRELRRIRADNHFAEQIENIFHPRQQP